LQAPCAREMVRAMVNTAIAGRRPVRLRDVHDRVRLGLDPVAATAGAPGRPEEPVGV